MTRLKSILIIVAICYATTARAADAPLAAPQPRAAFARGLPASPDFFPIAVWLQDPKNATKYKEVGVNVYVALYRGPTEEQIAALEKAGMFVILSQNDRARQFMDRKSIVAWMHGDEPDNAQAIPGGKGYGPPIAPEKIVADYQRIKKADPTRPVMLNLGQGVAWDGWHGRGVRTNKPEDYPQYVKGCDIVSFDIYPVCHDNKAVAGKLWYVPFGVYRLRNWSGDQKPVWTCIETTCISNPGHCATPAQVKSEVWMALIHGAKGIIYFSHQFKPKFIEAGMLADPNMAAGIAAINKQIQELAPALNSPTADDVVRVKSSDPGIPVDILVKRSGRSLYVFAVAMRPGKATAMFAGGKNAAGKVTALGESRTLASKDGVWTDTFDDYAVHLYRIDM